MPLSGEIHWDIWVLWKDEILDILVLTRGQRAHAAGGLCNAHSWSDVEMRDLAKSRPDSSRASASLSLASFYFLPAWLPRMSTSRVLSIQESAQHVLEWGGGPCPPPFSSSRRSIKLGKSRKFNGSIGPGFIGPSFGVDSADWSHCQVLKFCTMINLGNVCVGLLKVSNISRVRKRASLSPLIIECFSMLYATLRQTCIQYFPRIFLVLTNFLSILII